LTEGLRGAEEDHQAEAVERHLEERHRRQEEECRLSGTEGLVELVRFSWEQSEVPLPGLNHLDLVAEEGLQQIVPLPLALHLRLLVLVVLLKELALTDH